MTYIPAQYRVRVEFTKFDCDDSRKPPDDLELRVLSKLDSEVKKGKLESYLLFMDRLTSMWKMIRKSKQPEDTVIAITLANGLPPMPEVEVKKGKNDNDDILGRVTVNAPSSVVKTWRQDLFQFKIRKALLDLGVKELPSPGQSHGLYLQACAGKGVINAPIRTSPTVEFHSAEFENIDLVIDPDSQNVLIVVRNLKNLMDDKRIGRVVKAVETKAKSIQERRKVHLEVMTEHIVRRLRSANRGPERYGIDLPLVILGAHVIDAPTKPSASSKGAAAPASKASPKKASAPSEATIENLKPFIKIDIPEDKMKAVIVEINEDFHNMNLTVSEPLILKLLGDLGIVNGIDTLATKEIATKINAKEDIKGIVVAEGRRPKSGEEPFLYPSYQHQGENETAQVDMRAIQQKLMVRKDQLVAEVRYTKPALAGLDVHGNEVTPEPGEDLEVDLGVGIRAEGTNYYAEKDGIPDVSDKSIVMSDITVHTGSVNLTSGNVDFDGDLHIEGNIELGASVRVGKNLSIGGMIQGGSASAGDTLVATGGIVGEGSKSVIRCGGNLTTEFIENAFIICGGSIQVKKTIMSSRIYADKDVAVLDGDGLIAGGQLICSGNVSAANVGRSGGAITHVKAGTDYKGELRLTIKRGRHVKITERLQKEESALSELKGRSGSQITPKNQEVLDALTKKVTRLKDIEAKLTQQIEATTAELKNNPDAYIAVKETVSSATEIYVGSQRVGIKDDIAGVKLVGKRIGGSYITALEPSKRKSD
jgi:hypothetical protein